VGVELTARDRFICRRVGPVLREMGILLAGLDVIGERLTEINVTSPTCARELERIYGINIAGAVLDAIERAGSTDAQAISRALAATRTFDGATGSLAFGGGTDLERGGVIKQIKNGAVITAQVMPAE
jgi:hypothetical protein